MNFCILDDHTIHQLTVEPSMQVHTAKSTGSEVFAFLFPASLPPSVLKRWVVVAMLIEEAGLPQLRRLLSAACSRPGRCALVGSVFWCPTRLLSIRSGAGAKTAAGGTAAAA